MKLYHSLGVNRVSIGIQSTHDRLLDKLGRVHSESEAYSAIDNVFKSGIKNVSVDLICGVPEQSLEDLNHSIDRLTDYPISHLSCYLLTLAPHHRMSKDLPNEDTQIEHLLFIDRKLKEKGFEHYEISNFARDKKFSRHNTHYWSHESYLSFGPSAHSFSKETSLRWKNFSSIHKYAESLHQNDLPIEFCESLSAEQLELERWMLKLRMNKGIPLSWIATESQQNHLKSFMNNQLIEVHPEQDSHIRLTARGFAISDEIISLLSPGS